MKVSIGQRWRTGLLAVSLGVTGALAAPPSPSGAAGDIARTIGDLGHAKFAVREDAGRRLMKLAETDSEAVLRECLAVYKVTGDPEVKVRLRGVMERVVDRYLFRSPKGFLGVSLPAVFVGPGGHVVIGGVEVPSGAVWVGQVIEGSGAEQAGLKPNDFIIGVDTQRWTTGPTGFTEYVRAKRPGDRLKLRVVRGAGTNEFDVVLGELPEKEQEQLYTPERSRAYFEEWLHRQLERRGGN